MDDVLSEGRRPQGSSVEGGDGEEPAGVAVAVAAAAAACAAVPLRVGVVRGQYRHRVGYVTGDSATAGDCLGLFPLVCQKKSPSAGLSLERGGTPAVDRPPDSETTGSNGMIPRTSPTTSGSR